MLYLFINSSTVSFTNPKSSMMMSLFWQRNLCVGTVAKKMQTLCCVHTTAAHRACKHRWWRWGHTWEVSASHIKSVWRWERSFYRLVNMWKCVSVSRLHSLLMTDRLQPVAAYVREPLIYQQYLKSRWHSVVDVPLVHMVTCRWDWAVLWGYETRDS